MINALNIIPKKTDSCPVMGDYAIAKDMNRSWKDRKKGDIVLFDFNGNGTSDHIGIVVSVNKDGSITTVEGNTGSGSNTNGGQVQKRTRYKSQVNYFVRPKYNDEVTADMVIATALSQVGVKESPRNSNKVKYNEWFYGSNKSAYWCCTFVCWVFAHVQEKKTMNKYDGELTLPVVMIGQANRGERGKHTGGKAGDQDHKEVAFMKWSYSSKSRWNHWTHCFRADEDMAKKLADDMRWACKNNNIGYDAKKPDRYSLYEKAKKVGWNCSKVKSKCETTCGQLVAVCLLYAGIKMPKYCSNITVCNHLVKSDKFKTYKDKEHLAVSGNLLSGDVLVAKGHHTCIVTQGASLVYGDEGTSVKQMQKFLVWYGFSLSVDGIFGPKTKEAVKEFQKREHLTVDGIFGKASLNRAKAVEK